MAKSIDLIMAVFLVSKLENITTMEGKKKLAEAQCTVGSPHWPTDNISF